MAKENKREPTAFKSVSGKPFWGWPIMWVLIIAILTGGIVFLAHSCLKTPEAATDKLRDTAKGFHDVIKQDVIDFVKFVAGPSEDVSARILTNFRSFQPELKLQLATFKEDALIERTDSHWLLPDVKLEARAPISYTYFVDLNGTWNFLVQNRKILVFPPAVQCNTPAYDVGKLTISVKEDSVLRRTEIAKEAFHNELMGYAWGRSKIQIPLIKENARKQLKTFVETWIKNNFANTEGFAVEVYFPDEKTGVTFAPARN